MLYLLFDGIMESRKYEYLRLFSGLKSKHLFWGMNGENKKTISMNLMFNNKKNHWGVRMGKEVSLVFLIEERDVGINVGNATKLWLSLLWKADCFS